MSSSSPIPELEQGLLVGYGCDSAGGYLVVDDVSTPHWRRQRFGVIGAQFTLQGRPERLCTGRCDLESGHSEPCPDRAELRENSFEQCSACRRATGFNPAFYFAAEISPQQRRRNLEPHLTYLAHFGAGTFKVGMTYARRGVHRLLEQGARAGVLLARFDDAYRARALEERIARELGVPETVRAARKRHLLGAPSAPHAVRAELEAVVEQVRLTDPDIPLAPEYVELDAYYGGSALFERTPTDLSETEPLGISGRCVGMIGDVLVADQAGQRFVLSVGGLVARGITLRREERPNRVAGQMRLPF